MWRWWMELTKFGWYDKWTPLKPFKNEFPKCCRLIKSEFLKAGPTCQLFCEIPWHRISLRQFPLQKNSCKQISDFRIPTIWRVVIFICFVYDKLTLTMCCPRRQWWWWRKPWQWRRWWRWRWCMDDLHYVPSCSRGHHRSSHLLPSPWEWSECWECGDILSSDHNRLFHYLFIVAWVLRVRSCITR